MKPQLHPENYIECINQGIDNFVETQKIVPTDGAELGLGEVALNACLELLASDGKRLRGSLVMAGYQMLGGEDNEAVTHAAVAIEAIHTYMLIMDDLQDRAETRRNGITVHKHIEQYLSARPDFEDADIEHLARSYTENAAASLFNMGLEVMQGLDIGSDAAKNRALSLIFSTMISTSRGQSKDLESQQNFETSRAAIEEIIHSKTAIYSFMMPLQVGMILAHPDIGQETLNDFDAWATDIGYAFQVLDDAKPYIGKDNSKDPMSDFREGKMTVFVETALRVLEGDDLDTVKKALGNRKLTKDQFAKVRIILEQYGIIEAEIDLALKKASDAEVNLQKILENPIFNKDKILALAEITNSLLPKQ